MSENDMSENDMSETSLIPPPPILVLTMTTDLEGNSNLNYNMAHEDAVKVLRAMADSLEERIGFPETSGQ